MSQLLSEPVDYKNLKKGDKIYVHLLGKETKFSRSENVKKHLSKNAAYKQYAPLLEKRENDDFKTSFSTRVMSATVKDVFRVKSKSNNPSIPMMIIGSTNYGEYAFVSDRDAFYRFRTEKERNIMNATLVLGKNNPKSGVNEPVKKNILSYLGASTPKMGGKPKGRKSKTIKRGRKTRRQNTRRQNTRRQNTRKR
mgnify:CR=1 FL=1|tara:strand:- start:758 stop:1342 length:585 start_codon:yes stop_codon:yes gene_type:complete